MSGYVENVIDAAYHADRERVNASTLKTLIAKTPAHARAAWDTPQNETPALLLGRAVHCAVLEPETFNSRFAIAPKCDRRTSVGKQRFAEFEAEHAGKQIISEADAEIIAGISQSIAAHPIASKLFNAGAAEVTGYFSDPETGVKCRIRPDYLRADDSIIVDLKTTTDASRDSFQRAIHQYGYALQAAFYSHGHKQITGEPLSDFLFVAVEKAQPFACAVYRLDEAALEQGQRQMRRALALWGGCLESGRWPGYSERIESISLPNWAFNLIEDLEQ